MTIKRTKGDLLDIMSLQEQVEQIVFDYMDTSVRYEIAYEQLNPLFQETINYYMTYLDKQQALPTASTYWHMFASTTAQLSFFLSVVLLSTAKTDEQRKEGMTLAHIAVTSLPYVQAESIDLVVQEMNDTYTRLLEGVDQQQILAKLKQPTEVDEALRVLADYAKAVTQ
ncbi:hypothetical protein GCM10007425_22300 [Lysinibacillus alkalisoli]|uniref:Uncharacterized protein n=1 Tax=Lysinibacillus alkalisoli TaxID=1911548 RepID=A0A917G7Z1_9BACI|nr:hypothetical protein [Lysinibacillus alkalisoli]GGG27275.1 hypothetical protein GCM10007425_22300 [Lysinibacillus alkalisoli]